MLDKTPLIYHEAKLSICCWCLIMYEENYRLYASVDHERNRYGYRKITFTIFNIIRKRMITRMMARRWAVLLVAFYCGLMERGQYGARGELLQ
jgi:hypothetical protein